MYLSRLEVIGFKSFAQRVNLDFDSGISAIVGPNGCGKTNIVDAIRWVLGEQRYSALRSEKMEDIIFNGTKQRKPLGMAEASLVIENTKGVLPSEYSQVTVTRRVYRSGESEYLLNKVPVRLKDILDLFMDTGMGADAYSVIELKMVETILSDQADERRRLFEEAAGVTKYKHRRRAAYRKLESVQADLLRVNDIVSEVHKAVITLERQARRAGQYNEVRDRLRNLEIDLMEREYAQLLGRVQPLQGRLGVLNQDKERVDVDLSGEETRLEQKHQEMAEVERRLAEVQRRVAEQVEALRHVEQQRLMNSERMKAQRENIARFEDEKGSLLAEKTQIEFLLTDLRRSIIELEGNEKRITEELSQRKASLREFESGLDRKRVDLQGLNDRTIALVHEIATLQTSQERKRARVENLHGRAARATEEIASYQSEIARLDGEIADLTERDRELRRRFAEAEMQHYEAEAKEKDLKERIDKLTSESMSLQNEVERKAANIDFLRGLIESREGLPQGVRYLSTTDRWAPGTRVPLADVVFAEERFGAAIEAALGEYASLIVVDTLKDAEEGIALLRQEQQGEATFVCLQHLPEIRTHCDLPAIEGVLGWASDIARCDEPYRQLARFVLDRVLVVDTAAAAARVVATVPGVRCVSLDGQMASSAGIARGGARGAGQGRVIGRQSRIDEHAKEIAVLQERLNVTDRERTSCIASRDAIQLKDFIDAVKGVEKEMNGVEVHMAQLQFEKRRAGDTIARNTEEIELLSGESSALAVEIDAAMPALEKLGQEKSEVERTMGALQKELEVLEQEWSERSKAVHDLGIRLVTAKNDLQNVLNEVERSEKLIATIIATVARREEDVTRLASEIGNLAAEDGELGTRSEVLEQELESLKAAQLAVEEESTRVRSEIHDIELRIKEERRTHDDSLKAAHELELKIADLKAKADHIRSRAQEEYEISIELKSYPETEFVDFAEIRTEIQALREKQKSLGNINFAAFEEYNTEKQRFEFLTAQRKDLLEAEKALLTTIEEINTTAQKKFLDTFAKIRSNFIETFKGLFDPGDECDVRLEEGVDPLEARIEIIAKPRGKRPTSIDLLSGGEKTLTAIALLFAIYLVKPSPFCILDEVDAPLDDANIDRYTRILRRFCDNTQFIVVTHNKRTMEAANALYGVTMEEEGVSKIVTVRFSRGAEVKSAAVLSG